ncbi:hypothetical protein CRG98_006934 [Punica granatum]|uniref:Uncharacterized protein n=1 Tax=Punica granatum TaxID=22663 RepID=A0A2I0KWD9_PUNGR|nr:hypothetical protein CRG98_006934 [Punica granatum]
MTCCGRNPSLRVLSPANSVRRSHLKPPSSPTTACSRQLLCEPCGLPGQKFEEETARQSSLAPLTDKAWP